MATSYISTHIFSQQCLMFVVYLKIDHVENLIYYSLHCVGVLYLHVVVCM